LECDTKVGFALQRMPQQWKLHDAIQLSNGFSLNDELYVDNLVTETLHGWPPLASGQDGNFLLSRPYHGARAWAESPDYPGLHHFAAGAAKTGVYVNPN
jgi:hypothetical protein